MGSATRGSLGEARAALAQVPEIRLETAEQLLQAGRVIGSSNQLRNLLGDPGLETSDKTEIVRRVFSGSLDSVALQLVTSIAGDRWSSDDDLLEAVEDLGMRAAARSASPGTDIVGELFEFGKAVRSNASLELAVSSKLGTAAAKASLVTELLVNASQQTRLIVSHLVQQPRGRRISELLRQAAAVVSDESGRLVATVTVARPIAGPQLERLREGLARAYGRNVAINQVIDESVIGGLRVRIGNDVIDGSVATKLNDLRLQLA
jgi:F-type H+-transporting ATPase subunit delta